MYEKRWINSPSMAMAWKKNASDETCYAYGVVAGVCVCNADL